MPLLLAIESSCDETAVSIVRGQPGAATEILASEISSQIELHRVHGGVVPELASRNHSLRLRPLVEQALDHAGLKVANIDAFAATTGPGLASSLLIGSTAAKALACATGKPFLAINHLEGHLLSPFVGETHVPPHLALIVYCVRDVGDYVHLGGTRDDAAGEAYDKVGKMLGLPYPGGPEIEKIAHQGDPAAFDFPRSMLHDPHHDFSFSGLKTAVLYTIQSLGDHAEVLRNEQTVANLAASFQQAVIEILVGKTVKAARKSGHKLIALSGGVSLNGTLRAAFEADNAAMIAFAALLRHLEDESSPLDADIDPNLALV